jgi:hypothetical protein
MKGLRFEWIGNRHYSAVLHFGESFVPVEDKIMERLATWAAAPPDKFLERVIEQIGNNSYLKDTIRQAAEETDPRVQTPEMQEFLRKHKF